jgi:hypothetical protein
MWGCGRRRWGFENESENESENGCGCAAQNEDGRGCAALNENGRRNAPSETVLFEHKKTRIEHNESRTFVVTKFYCDGARISCLAS